MATRRTVLVIWCVIFACALGLTAVAAFFGPAIWSRVGNAGSIVAWVVLGMAAACFVAARVLPNRMKPAPGTSVESMAVARSIVATALHGSVALQAPLAWMVSGKVIALVALAISLVGLLLVFPSQERWNELRRSITVALGQELTAGANASTRSPSSRNVMVSMVALIVLAAVALGLSCHMFWSAEVLRKPVSPTAQVALVTDLALAMTLLGVVRLIGAAAKRRPRLQRAYGVLQLLVAGYLFVQAFRMM